MPTGMLRRDGRYSIRRVIPLDLRPAYNGKQVITRALKTSDPALARELHALEWVKLDREFNAARTQLRYNASVDAPAKPQRSPEESARLARAWEDHQSREIEEGWRNRDQEEGEDTLGAKVASGVEQRLAVIAEEHAELRRIKREEDKAAGKARYLGEIVRKWATEKKPSLKIIETTTKTVDDFYEVVGKLPVNAITKQHVIDYKDHLVAKGQHPATANGRLTKLRVVLRYAVANAMIPHDPSSGIRIASKLLARDSRTSYDSEALAAVFGSPVYTKGTRYVAGAGEAAYWLPLLGLYTGARLNELGQLRPGDVIEESYIGEGDAEHKAWVIRIVHDEAAGLRLKTLSSQRRVPVHAELIALGFLRYVADAKAKGQASLFPMLKPDKYGTITAGWSKWYGRYLRGECGVKDKRTVFHSFRHTFKENARYSQVAPDVQNEITGHDSGNVADDYGGLHYPLHPLVEGMKRYRVPRFTPPPSPKPYR